jgi:1-acyl-sn-glycerol-3-phosphate acyltransferase
MAQVHRETTSMLLTPETLPKLSQRLALRLLRLFGWKFYYDGMPGPRGVVIVYPHTSNWDTVIALLTRVAVDEPVRWLGKEALFKGISGAILGPILRATGCEPIERSASTGAIQRIVERMSESDWYWLGLAPEGTRSFRERWRSGFYHIALAAKVPVLVVGLDYPSKTIRADKWLMLSGDKEKDRAAIADVYRHCRGLHPEKAGTIDW